MADRLTELQDAINLQAQNLCNAVGVIQQIAQPSFFSELNYNGRIEKEWTSNPEFQALLQSQNQEDISHKFAVSIAATAKQIELLINSLPAEEASLEIQDEATRQLLSEYRRESAKLVHLITKSFQQRLSKVRQLLSQIAETQLLTRTIESEVGYAGCYIPVFLVLPILKKCTTISIMESPKMTMATEEVYSTWLSHLSFSLIAIIVSRLVGLFLPIVLPKLATIILPSCRARHTAFMQTEKEIRDLRRQMSQLNMVDNFASYSKLERKLKVLERQQAACERSQLGTTVVSSLVAQCLRYALQGILIGWLVFQSPCVRLTEDQVAASREARAFYNQIPVGWLVVVVHYIPSCVLLMAWVALCEAAASFIVSYVQRKIEC
ncbi:unnamed protein product [Mesocestoides corti]|uniref:Mediator of RNA polymerase II transcription subunit 21 n=2 Tax=Mesocestoides corti TaxID=53468 RepID=A0A0R3U782_MESCO|nr:unnamed protein product [Mesocestoides corti]